MKKKLYAFFLCVIVMYCLLATHTNTSIENTNQNDILPDTTEKEDTDIQIPDVEPDTSTEVEKKTDSYLFIGSSYFYYNNVPELVYNFAKCGTGNEIEMATCTLNGQTLREHANAIKTIIRTKGDINQLTEKEKNFFKAEKSSGEIRYEDFLYERYAQVFWDYENNCAKQYSYIVLSPICHKKYGEGSSEDMARSMSTIISNIGTKDTKFVFHYTHIKMCETVEEFAKEQSEQDSVYDQAIELVKANEEIANNYSSIHAARSSTAYYNYLMYYGSNKAIEKEKEAYEIYSEYLSRHDYNNDLYLKENEHITVLGSYIMASSIYVALFGESEDCLSAFDISESYHGKTTGECMNLRFENSYKTNYGLYYNNGDGFKSKEICKAASFIVEQTQLNDMDFLSKSDVEKWKEDSNKVNYTY